MKFFIKKIGKRIARHLKSNSLTRPIIINYIKKIRLKTEASQKEYIDSAVKIKSNYTNFKNIGLIKDEDTLSFNYFNTYWPKFQRFLETNNIRYDFFDIKRSDWIDKLKNYDLIIWRTPSDPFSLYEARLKIKIIENNYNIKCYPSSLDLEHYEDKIKQFYLLKYYNLPIIPTFISFSYNEVIEYLNKANFPIVSKSFIGSGSISVRIIKNKRDANIFIRKVFSKGIDIGFDGFKHVNYVYFQDFIPDALYDLRVILVGEKIFGYFRMKPKNDFRASGAGIFIKNALPIEAVKIALEVKKRLNSKMIAVDFIKSESVNKFQIIEASIFFGVETPEQLLVNNLPGYYLYENDKLVFKEGRFWVQELLLNEIIK